MFLRHTRDCLYLPCMKSLKDAIRVPFFNYFATKMHLFALQQNNYFANRENNAASAVGVTVIQ